MQSRARINPSYGNQDPFSDFVERFDIDRWEIFCQSPEAERLLGTEKIERADHFLSLEILRRLLQTREHTDDSIRLGQRLLRFPNPEIASFVIMNCYREPGHSGEYPFISQFTASFDTEVFKYIATLGEEDIETMRGQNIPGLMEIIDLIKANPDTFNTPRDYDREKKVWIENEVKLQIHRELAKMATYLAKADPRTRYFVLALFERLDVDLGEGYEVLETVLNEEKDPQIRERLLESSLRRAESYNDSRLSDILLTHFDELNPETQHKILAQTPRLVGGYVGKEIGEKQLEILSNSLEITKEELRTLLSFLAKLEEHHYYYGAHNDGDQKQLRTLIDLSQNPDILPFITAVSEYGFRFDTYVAGALPDLAARKDEVIAEIQSARTVFPDYQYHIYYDLAYNPEKETTEYFAHGDPYESLARQKTLPVLLERLAEMQVESGEFESRISRGLTMALREKDPLLAEVRGRPVPPESIELFHQNLSALIKETCNPEGSLYDFQDAFLSESAIMFLARQPEKIGQFMDFPTQCPDFIRLIQPGGPLFTNREKILKNVFENGDFIKRVKEVETIFTQRIPLWRQLFLFSDVRLGERLAASPSQYPITEIAGISLGTLVQRHRRGKERNPEAHTRLEMIIPDISIVERLVRGEIESVPFSALSGMFKREVFRDYLRRTIETSRSNQAKAQADQRNRETAQSRTLSLLPGTYTHGSAIDFIDMVLLNGNLPGEALGEGADTDRYPFQVDFGRLGPEIAAQNGDTDKILTRALSGDYGTAGSLGSSGQIFYLYNRSYGSWERGKDYGSSQDHALILGGMPSTEISGIVLRDPVTFIRAKQSVLEHGFYIPIYDINGTLILTPEDFDSAYDDHKMGVPVETWDYSLRTGEQKGSNTGGEYTVPTERGPVRYYVKNEYLGNNDQLWNEQLADNIYRHTGIPVPNTQMISTEGSSGHASEILPDDGGVDRRELKSGFIVDCLLANWDIVGNSANYISSGGVLYRIDNGGSLLFRARGERRESQDFGPVVTELQSLRPGYPGLSAEDIRSQVAVLQERFPDEAIDTLVDSVRLGQADRTLLKERLRERRDYIVSYYTEGRPAVNREINESGQRIVGALEDDGFNDEVIGSLVPEWTRINSNEGYQHNGALLGEHVKTAIRTLKESPEYIDLTPQERNLSLVAAMFHDIAKPTGRQNETVPRDFSHDTPSAQIAARYLEAWGFSDADIRVVVDVILNDGIVSNIARGKVRDETKNLTPEQLRVALSSNPSTIKILRVLNRADVVATVGQGGFEAIARRYNEYFDQIV